MIFLTVGTQFPFDRLVRAVDAAAGKGMLWEEVFAQIGAAKYRPAHMKWAEELGRAEYTEAVNRASAIIGHAGMGTILTALDARKPLLVMPRLAAYGEAVNDHQVATATKFAAAGHVLAAADETHVEDKLRQLRQFMPNKRAQTAGRIVEKIAAFLAALERA